MTNTKLDQAIAKIDAANAADPNMMDDNGRSRPVALVHAEKRTAYIHQLTDHDPSEALLIAARAQHLRRWEIPRDNYPRDRVGYLKWRSELKQFHADQTAVILSEVGYDETFIERVKAIILKRQIKQDPEVQAVEDALCLVFLETQFTAFAQQEADKIIAIVRKTWQKMSPRGHALALKLPLTAADQAIIEQALK
ncbi:MAG: DUF4202 domain-containing protein [Anaerolineales bacterium]|nr:DUF4202 domain-containing protein [Anaerolineales bacterium]